MNNVKSTVYYINNEHDKSYLDLSVKTMHAYWWVSDIVILHTDPIKPNYLGDLEKEYFKVSEYWQNFGHSFDIPVEKGGFDEVSCRNYAVELAESKRNEWIISCDPDEFFTSFLGEVIKYMTEENIDKVVQISCFPFISPSIYVWDRRSAWGKTFVMHDPHIRVWRRTDNLRYVHATFRKNNKNSTQDCHIQDRGKRKFYEPKICHIHVHDMFGPKTKRLPLHILKEIDLDYKILENPRDIFPDHYIQAYVDHLKRISILQD